MADDGPAMTIADYRSAMTKIASHLQGKSLNDIRDDLAIVLHDYRGHLEDELILRLIAMGGALTRLVEDGPGARDSSENREMPVRRGQMTLQ